MVQLDSELNFEQIFKRDNRLTSPENLKTKEYRMELPVMNNVADQTVWMGGGYIGALGTQAKIEGNFRNMPEFRSSKGTEYEFIRNALPELPPWAKKENSNIWAPDTLNGLTVLISGQMENGDFAIGAAFRETIDEPFTASDKPLIADRTGYMNIDPSIRNVTDADGR